MEFTPSPSSIFQNKKIKYNNKKPTKNGIMWINFSKIRKARCTLTPLSLRSARLTQYMRFARCTSLSHILLRFTTQNIAYTETLAKIASLFWLMGCDFVAVILCRYATSANSNYTQFTSKISDFIVN
jgi:hypothetical protein